MLKLSPESNDLGRNLRDRTLVKYSEFAELVYRFLQTIAYDFIDDLTEEIDTALKDHSPIISAFNVFLPSEATSLIDRNEQLEIIRNHYGKDITDTYQSKSTFAGKLIDPIAQNNESEEFFSEFEDAYVSTRSSQIRCQKKLQSGELNQEPMYKHKLK